MERGVGLILGSEPLSSISLSQVSYHVRILPHSGRESKSREGSGCQGHTAQMRFPPPPQSDTVRSGSHQEHWDNEVADTSFPS